MRPPIFLSPCRKKDSAAPGGRKKRALRAIDNSVSDTLYARLPNLGANCIQVGNLFAPVSTEGFAYARAAAGKDRRGRWPRPASLAPSGQFTFCPHRPAFGSCIGSIWGSTPTDSSLGRIQRGAEAPLCVVLIRESQGRARRVKQTCRGHVCSQSGEQTCLRPGQEKSKSSPPKCRFSCNFSLGKQREVEFAACAHRSAGTNR